MLAYYSAFPEKSKTELRTLTIPEHEDFTVPWGTYAFTEYFCPDLTCDCQRLLVKVFHQREPNAVPKDVATFSYTWNVTRQDSCKAIIDETPNPFLDPFHPQMPYAEEMMEFWADMVRRDPEYADRIKRHYVELRRFYGMSGSHAIGEEFSAKTSEESVDDRRRRRRMLRRQQARRRMSK